MKKVPELETDLGITVGALGDPGWELTGLWAVAGRVAD